MKEEGNVFDRSGLAALSDLGTSGYRDAFARLEKEQEIFLEKEPAFRSKEYKWPRDPLHNFSRVWEYPYVYHHLGSYLKTLPINSRPLVADVGSGVTFFPFSLAKLGYRVVCTDIDCICEKDLPLASANVPHSPGTVDFRLITDSSIPFEDGECDALYCISVLEHIPAFERTVAEIARVLNPGGLCLLTCDVNFRPEDGVQLGIAEYARLITAVDATFDQVYPERTIHPGDALTTLNSPYPFGRRLGIAEIGYQLIKQKLLKPLLGRKAGRVTVTPPYVGVLGLILQKRK